MPRTHKPYHYEEAKRLLSDIKTDINILAGDTIGLSGVSWQDVAGTLAVNLRVYALRLDAARAGNVVDGPVVFPSLVDLG